MTPLILRSIRYIFNSDIITGMKVVTSGLTFLDIDGYACAVAYAELLNLQGQTAIAFSSAVLNESISKTVQSWQAPLSTNYIFNDNDSFILVDVSEIDFLDKVVEIDRVEEVIDHHVGFEAYWQEKLGLKSTIELIGAACTQIYEKWAAASLIDRMSETSARLLISGILDNTLNFKSDVTTPRDIAAYQKLLEIAHLPDDWTAQYFRECEEAILSDARTAIVNDSKMMNFKNIDSDSFTFGQMVIWDGSHIINEYRDIIEQTMKSSSEDWFINVVSIDAGISYFICSNDKVCVWANKVVGAKFDGLLGRADRLWLRKEIVRQDASI